MLVRINERTQCISIPIRDRNTGIRRQPYSRYLDALCRILRDALIPNISTVYDLNHLSAIAY